jgi:nitrogen regulatory protein P-II 1
MFKIEAVIHPLKLDETKAALALLGIENITIVHVLNCAGSSGLKAFYRGGEYHVDVPKVKLELIVSSLRVDEVIDSISRAARTGMPGEDGTIMLYEIAEAIRIRNGHRVEFSLSD